MAFTNLQEASQSNQADGADFPAHKLTLQDTTAGASQSKSHCIPPSSLPTADAQHALQGTQLWERTLNTFCIYKFFHFRFFSFIFLIT